MAYDNNNQGMLARNERKTQPNHPDYSGQCEVNGVQMWISAWIKEGKGGGKMAGKKFFSLAFKPKDGAPSSQATAADADAMESTGAPVSQSVTEATDEVPY